jgi:hypothetical protein
MQVVIAMRGHDALENMAGEPHLQFNASQSGALPERKLL